MKSLYVILLLLLLIPIGFSFDINEDYNITINSTHLLIKDYKNITRIYAYSNNQTFINIQHEDLDCDNPIIDCNTKDFNKDYVDVDKLKGIFNVSLSCPVIPPSPDCTVTCNDNATQALLQCQNQIKELTDTYTGKIDGITTAIINSAKDNQPYILLICFSIIIASLIMIGYNYLTKPKNPTNQPQRYNPNQVQYHQPPQQSPQYYQNNPRLADVPPGYAEPINDYNIKQQNIQTQQPPQTKKMSEEEIKRQIMGDI